MRAKTPIDIGLLLREQRRKLGLDQAALAERIGVSRQWLVEVEGGKPRAEIGLVLRALGAVGLVLDVKSVDSAAKPTEPPTKTRPHATAKSRPRKPSQPPAEIDIDAVIERARGRK